MPDDAYDLGPVPTRLPVTEVLARRLVAGQFPRWAHLPIRPVSHGGWDNWTFHLGTDLVVRLPSAAEYALAVEKEHRWLPVLAPALPVPIPEPLAKGQPDENYPYAWSIYRWLPGVTASADRITDPTGFARDLAGVVAALRRVDATDGPRPGIHNWFRGGPLHTYDDATQQALADLTGHLDVPLAREVWAEALRAPWDGVDRWFHGDLAAGNLLLEDGHLSAVIDFGTCGIGDPACDLAIVWTLLTESGRRQFREQLAVDDDEWARGRGWALWKTLTEYAGALENAEDGEAARASRVLDQIFADHTGVLRLR